MNSRSQYSFPGEEAGLAAQKKWQDAVRQVMEPYLNKDGKRNESPVMVVRIYDMIPQVLMGPIIQKMGVAEFIKYKNYVERCRKLLPEKIDE